MTHGPKIGPKLFKPLPPLFPLSTSKPSSASSASKPSLSRMAPKKLFHKRHPLDDPPSASSSCSSEEDEQVSGKEEEVKNTTAPSSLPKPTPKEQKKPGYGFYQRLWTEDDEIAILEGMIKYHSQKGTDPYSALGKFHDFIKNSLSVDASKSQFVDKVKKMKAKYIKIVEKGERAVFSKPHDLECFELSKKVWGRGGEKKRNGVDGNGNGKHWSKRARTENGTETGKEEAGLAEALKGEMMEDMKVDKLGVFWATHPCLKQSLARETETLQFDLSIKEPVKSFMLENMSIIGSVKAKELEKKWKDFCVDEVALYLKRAELNKRRAEMIEEQTKLLLDAMKASYY